jgi:hypothetical protein
MNVADIATDEYIAQIIINETLKKDKKNKDYVKTNHLSLKNLHIDIMSNLLKI